MSETWQGFGAGMCTCVDRVLFLSFCSFQNAPVRLSPLTGGLSGSWSESLSFLRRSKSSRAKDTWEAGATRELSGLLASRLERSDRTLRTGLLALLLGGRTPLGAKDTRTGLTLKLIGLAFCCLSDWTSPAASEILPCREIEPNFRPNFILFLLSGTPSSPKGSEPEPFQVIQELNSRGDYLWNPTLRICRV